MPRFAYNRSASNEHGGPPSHYLLFQQLAVTTPCERFARIREGKSNRMIFISKSRIISHTLVALYTFVIVLLFTSDSFMWGKSKVVLVSVKTRILRTRNKHFGKSGK